MQDKKKIKREFRKILLSISGMKENEIENIDIDNLSNDDFIKLVRDTLSRRH